MAKNKESFSLSGEMPAVPPKTDEKKYQQEEVIVEQNLIYPFTKTSPLKNLAQRLITAAIAMALLISSGTLGYYLIGDGKWKLIDCLYMTVLSITTVGYGEIIPIDKVPSGRPFTILLLIMGVAVNAYFISTITAFFLSEEFEGLWWRKNMERLISKMNNHIIVCGGGETGIHVLKELNSSGREFVLIDDNIERARGLQEILGRFPIVIGDATEEKTLQKAGISKAYGLVCALPTDKDNLFVTITARNMNPNLKIVSKGIEINAIDKLRRAGADRVVSPNYIGGVRIAAEMLRPHVVQFLDLVSQKNELDLLLEEVVLSNNSPYCGKKLYETDLRKREILVLAIRSPTDNKWIYNPPPNYELKSGATLIILGKSSSIKEFCTEQEKY